MRGDPPAQAGHHKPRVQGLLPGKRSHGPQHQVKPAASSDLQPEGRAAHVTAKATSFTGESKLVKDFGGVEGAARVEGEAWNTRDPSVQPGSGRTDPYKPKA